MDIFDEMKSRVYVRVDENNRVVQIEGEYSLTNLNLNAPDVHKIDEGPGIDKYNHAQGCYLDGGLMTEDGIYQWKLVSDSKSPFGVKVVLRSETEIQADRDAIPLPPPTEQERLRADVDFIAAMQGLVL